MIDIAKTNAVPWHEYPASLFHAAGLSARAFQGRVYNLRDVKVARPSAAVSKASRASASEAPRASRSDDAARQRTKASINASDARCCAVAKRSTACWRRGVAS